MRLARIEYEGEIRAAVVGADLAVYPITREMMDNLDHRMDDIISVISLADADMAAFTKRVEAAISSGTLEAVKPTRWLPPVGRPGKIIGVAMNNSAFADASFRYFTTPSFFMKAPSCLVGHGEPVIVREDYGLTHPEAELACVIGRHASHLDETNARNAVFGYTIINDVTSVGLKDEDSLQLEFTKPVPGQSSIDWRRLRDEQDFDIYLTYHFRSKCTDTFGPIGPWVTTANDVPNPDALSIEAWLGDKKIAEDSTANLSFSIARVLAHLTRYTTLEPGDIVHFGTAVDPRRFALREANILKQPADMKITIDGLGTLINPVRVEV